MRIFDAATQAYIDSRVGVHAEGLIWIGSKSRITGLVEYVGVWTGTFDTTFVIDGVTRLYQGAGSVLRIEDITSDIGVSVRNISVNLAGLDPTIESIAREYDPRFAPIEIHRALFDLENETLVGTPHRIWKGFVDNVDFKTEAAGGSMACDLTCVSNAQLLTRTLAQKKSDDSHRLRNPLDRFRKYSTLTGQIGVFWGEKKVDDPKKPPANPLPIPVGGLGWNK